MFKRSCWVSLLLATMGGCSSKGSNSQSIEDTCARVTACGPAKGEASSFGECVQFLNTLELAIRQPDLLASDAKTIKVEYECLRAASTCDEFLDCGRATPSQLALCETAQDDICSGNVRISCSRERDEVTSMDCGEAGLVCGKGNEGTACGLAACDPATASPRCEGAVLFTCEERGNVLNSRNCAAAGMACGKRPDGTTGCVGQVACDDRKADMRCEGSVEVMCEHGTEARHDCCELGADWTCATKAQAGWTSAYCVPKAKDCTIGENETCSNGVIGYCEAGHPATYDCKSVGFSGCTTTADAQALCVK
jgi:hypothetical protein